MRDYGKIAPTFWTGQTGKSIREMGRDAQVLALYLLTCPSANMIGLYYLPLPTLMHEVGMTEEGALKALRSLSEVGFARFEGVFEHIFVPEMAAHQIGEPLDKKDNRVKGVIREWLSMRKSPFFKDFHERYHESFHLPSDVLDQAPCKPLRSQEQEQEQEQEQNNNSCPKKVSDRKNGYCESFERWWCVYPRREGKGKAFDAWVKAGKAVKDSKGINGVEAAAWLFERVTAYANSPRAKESDPSKIPLPATWLNQCRYDDDPATWGVVLTDRKQEEAFQWDTERVMEGAKSWRP